MKRVVIGSLAAAAAVVAMPAMSAYGAHEGFNQTASITELNNSGVSGTINLNYDASTQVLNVDVDAFGLQPNTLKPNHIHGRFNDPGTFNDPRDSVKPTAALDSDSDGLLEVLEAAPAYGPVLLNFTTTPTTPSQFDATDFPSADASGELHYNQSFDLTASLNGTVNANDDIFFQALPGNEIYEFTAADLFPLFFREYVIHGAYIIGNDSNGNGRIVAPDTPGATFAAALPIGTATFASPVPTPSAAAAGLVLLGGVILRRRRAA